MMMGVMGGFGLLVVAGALWWVVSSVARGQLARNDLFGIRTRATTASDEAWLQAHRAAEPSTRVLAALTAGFGVLLILLGVLGGRNPEPSAATVVTFIIGYGLVFVGALVIVRVANRAARASDSPSR